MPTLLQTTHGRVTALWGSALIRGADGKMHALKVGDIVNRGDVILTTQDGIVELAPERGTAVAVSGLEDSTLPVTLAGHDPDGSIVAVTVTTIPAGSQLLLADGVTPVVVGQALTPAQAGNLLFKPGPDFNGSTAITFTVTDDAGAVSGSTSVSFNVVAVNDAPIGAA